jgi:hypothetical protein
MSKVFISNLNSYLGQSLLEDLQELTDIEISGTLSPGVLSPHYPSSIKIILVRST